MKEQIYALKNRLAVAEDSASRSKVNTKDVAMLQGEINYLSETMRAKDLRILQLEEELAEAEALVREADDMHKISDQTWQTPEASQLDFYKDKVEELTAELDSLQCQIRQTDRVRDRIKTDYGGDVNQQLLRKEESLRTANKRFQQQQKRLDQLELTIKQLDAKNKFLESDRRKLLEKWQSTVNRTKGDDKLKAKCRELEAAVSEIRGQNLSLQGEVKQLLKKQFDSDAEHQVEIDKYAKVIEGFQKIKLQQRLDEDDRQILEKMNKELSIKASQLEAELEFCREQLELNKSSRNLTQTTNSTINERKKSENRESLTSLIEKLARESEKPLLSLKNHDEEQPLGPKFTRTLAQHSSLRNLSRMRRAQTPNTFERPRY